MSKFYETHDGSLTDETKNIFDHCNDLMNSMFKASDVSFVEILEGMDEKTGALVGGSMNLYKESKELALMQADIIDTMFESINELKRSNEELKMQNKKLQEMMEELIIICDKKN